ncbi:hypothetical protein BDU57DRAFT_527121 [Ampelomyces quisqualis]|uniref:Uncharacterized protein n=1 Tax=Ampelomyces quisqualis TaxID=50730 RepID=A0A6A5QUE6_AMPQU|nr:hypothetical protein BDU57DRAFT_527121 [Ampelomyces quisqualis]
MNQSYCIQMANTFPFRFGFTAAPTLDIHVLATFRRYTKLFTILSLLSVFVDHTFAAEDNVERGKRFAAEFFGTRRHLRSDNAQTNYTDSLAPEAKTLYATEFSARNTSTAKPDRQSGIPGNRTFVRVDESEDLKHAARIVEGISQELFFLDNEINFYDARSLDWFLAWASANEAQFTAERKRNPGLSVASFFAAKKLGSSNFTCDKHGCRNMPTPDKIKQGRDRHEARHIINILKSFEKANAEVRQYNNVLQEIKDELELQCENFSKIFFHGKTKGKKWMCPAKIAQIVMLVVTALIALVGVVTVSFTPGMMALAGAHPAIGTVATAGTVVETAVRSRMIIVTHLPRFTIWTRSIGGPQADEATNQAYAGIIDSTLSHTSPVPRGPTTITWNDGTTTKVEYGGFGMVEYFDATDLGAGDSSVYEQVQVLSYWHFQKYPRPAQEVRPQMATTGEIPRLKGRYFHRITRYFDIIKAHKDASTRNVPDEPLWNILLHLVDKKENPMDLTQTLDFLEKYGGNINARYQELRSSSKKFPSNHIWISEGLRYWFHPKVELRGTKDRLPWSSILAGLQFKGPEGVKHDTHESSSASTILEWRTNYKVGSHKNKRSGVSSDSTGHINHEILGQIKSLEALNIIEPIRGSENTARNSPDWTLGKRRDGNDDVFTVDVKAHYFKNEIHTEKCGIDSYTGETKDNEKGCREFIDSVVDRLISRMSKSFADAAVSPTATALYFRKRFSTYSTWERANTIKKDPKVKAKLAKNLQNSLISKAYADGNCFVRCGQAPGYQFDHQGPSVSYGPNVACQTGCYDPIKNQYERLYGFIGDKETSQGPAASPPWNLDEQKMNTVALSAYFNRDKYGYYPGSVNLDPYTPLIQDGSPILPVCYSDLSGYQDSLVCNCGNRYGDMTEEFANNVQLKAQGKQNEWKAMRSCLDQIKPYAYHSPATYLLNACHVVYTIVAPFASGSAQQKDDLGHYLQNYFACQKYWKFYQDNKGMSDKQLDIALCKLWGKHAKDFDRGPNHKHPDFSYVNDMLEDHGCKGYK